jgi:N4-gp56 family major capsid protein
MLLDNLYPELRFYQAASKKSLPTREGKSIVWTKYTKLNPKSTTLSVGVVPNATALSSSNVSATLGQYGDFVKISDLLSLTAIDPVIESATKELSEAAGLTIDTVIRNVLDANTNARRVNNKALSAMLATDVLSGVEVRNAVRMLKAKNVKPHTGGDFLGIIHPNCSYDLQGDTAAGGWVNANTYVNNQNILNGEIGRIHGVRFVESTNVSVAASGSGGVNVYKNHLKGRDAFAAVPFDGTTGEARIYVKTSGEQDTSNPLNQFSTVGYKATFASAILDGDRDVILQAASV